MGDSTNLDVVDKSLEGGDELQTVGDGFDLGDAHAQVPESYHNGFNFDLGRVENVEKSLKVRNEGVEFDTYSEVQGDQIDEGSKIGDGVDKKVVEFGSLMEEMMGKVSLGGEVSASSSSCSDEDDEVGPIRSKNEVQDPPPVPPVNLTIQPPHQRLPVGVVSSTIGSQVHVEGMEGHNTLSEGSILGITESKSALGIVDEIFTSFKNISYIVRYNSESEVPSMIQQGSLIQNVPEFIDFVVNNTDLYKNGEHDEVVVEEEEAEFSDYEKEIMQKMSKMGTGYKNCENIENDKKTLKNRSCKWIKNQNPFPSKGPPQNMIQRPYNQASTSRPQGPVIEFSGGPGLTLTFQPSPQPLYNSPLPGVWRNVTPFVHSQVSGMNFPYGVPGNIVGLHQNYPPQLFQMPLLSMVPFPEHFYPPGQMMPPPNLAFQWPVFSPWPTNMDQNVFYQLQFGPDLQSPYTPLPPPPPPPPPPLMNVQQREVLCGSIGEYRSDMRPPFPITGGDNSGNSSQYGDTNHGGRQPFRGGSQPFHGGRQPFRGGRQPFCGGRYGDCFGGGRGGARQPNGRS